MITDDVIVFDFETTGIPAKRGGRPVEVGAVLLKNGVVADQFESLMNPDQRIIPFVEELTGISNEAVQNAPPCEEVINEFADFMGNTPLVAHNAAFDLQFLDIELQGIKRIWNNPTTCSLRLSRRIFPKSQGHSLKALVEHCHIASSDVFHRALEDAYKTGMLLLAMIEQIERQFGLREVSFALLQTISSMGRRKMEKYLSGLNEKQYRLF